MPPPRKEKYMTIRIFDKFDKSFTVAKYDGVEAVYGDTICFEDGDEIQIDNEYEDWEEV